MSIAEKLVTVSENASRAVELNRDLETILAGGDTGGKSEMDEFWDMYQNYGNLGDYSFVFANVCWNSKTFRPKYSIRPTNAYMIFRLSNVEQDLVEWMAALGVELDFSNCTNMSYAFQQSKFTRLGIINATNTVALSNAFIDAKKLKTIDKLVLKSNGQNTFSGTFNGCSALENITIEGAIGNNIDFSTCTKLTHDSLMSIINHLQDKTGASTEPILTIGTTNYNKLTAEEIKIATDKGWEVV